jgi:hypothetical protein
MLIMIAFIGRSRSVRNVRHRAALHGHAGLDAGEQGLAERPERPEAAISIAPTVTDLLAPDEARGVRGGEADEAAQQVGFWSIMKLL